MEVLPLLNEHFIPDISDIIVQYSNEYIYLLDKIKVDWSKVDTIPNKVIIPNTIDYDTEKMDWKLLTGNPTIILE